MNKMGKIIRFGLVVLAIIISIQGCHTIRGVGKDIETGGEAIQDATR